MGTVQERLDQRWGQRREIPAGLDAWHRARFFTPAEILARAAGLENVWHVSAVDLTRRCFADRTGGLRPPANGAAFPVSTP